MLVIPKSVFARTQEENQITNERMSRRFRSKMMIQNVMKGSARYLEYQYITK